MVDVLDNLRSTLASTARGAWEGQEDARQALERSLDEHASDIRDCFDVPNSQACLEGIFDGFGIGEDLEGDWDGSAFADVITNLRDVGQQWSPEAREAVREIAQANDLDELHRMCTIGRVQDVADRLNATNFSDELNAEYGFSSPSSARECLQAVSLIQDVRTDLRQAWETA